VLEMASSLEGLRPYVGNAPGFVDAAVEFYRAQIARLSLETRPGEPDTDAVLREHVLSSFVRLDDAFASALAQRFGEIDRLPAAIRPAVALAFARTAGVTAFDALLARARSTADEDGAGTAGSALGGLRTPELLSRSLAASLEPGIRASVAHDIIAGVAQNPLGASVTWEWMKQNLRELEERSRGGWALSRLLERTLHLVGIGRQAEMEAYFAAESFPEAANGIRKSLEYLRIASRLTRRVAEARTG